MVFLKSGVTITGAVAMLVFNSSSAFIASSDNVFPQTIVRRCRCLVVFFDESPVPACHSQEPPHLFGGARLGKFLDGLCFCIVRSDASSPNYVS